MGLTVLQTEFEFTLPRGLRDAQGQVRQRGTMRLATARDELGVERHPRVRQEPGYEVLVRLAQVITAIDDLNSITPAMLEDLYTADLAYLREFYNRVNHQGDPYIPVECPQCQLQFQVELELAGEF
jgi:hypothetical protein